MRGNGIMNDKTVTMADIRASKGQRKLVMITAYDYTAARLIDETGVDFILVGDSLGMVMLGREDTVSVTLDEMIHHCKAVKRGARKAFIVADMPFMTYETGCRDALENAGRLFRESGVRAVKLEGGMSILPQVRALVGAGIPVMGHIGLTPQRIAQLGGFKVQGKNAGAAVRILKEAKALEEAGCFAVVLEAVPAPLADAVTKALRIPTIGIGAGAGCDGQVLVLHDMLGLYPDFTPRFVKKYAQLGNAVKQAVREYASEVRDGVFPTDAHSFAMAPQEEEKLSAFLAERETPDNEKE